MQDLAARDLGPPNTCPSAPTAESDTYIPSLDHEKGDEMALSDALAKMSAQAKEAEDKFHAAQTTRRAKLEEEVDKVRTATQERDTEFRARADHTKSEVSSRWHDVQEHWH